MTTKVTKAEKVRVILRRDLGKKTDEQILAAVMKATGHPRGLAKSYIKNNIPKVKAEKKKSSKKVAKKAAAKKRAAKK